MIHPDIAIRGAGPGRGLGVFASRALRKGTLLCVNDGHDMELSLPAVNKEPGVLRDKLLTYSYRDARGVLLLNWDESRYVNHCCHPNSLMTAYGFELVVRDIAAGEEITTDYGLLNVIEDYLKNR